MAPKDGLSARVIGRLALYRRLLEEMREAEIAHVFSHDLADRAGLTAAQVRRDVMGLGYLGSPARGYDVARLLDCLDGLLDARRTDQAVLAGVGNLGRALVSYFGGQRAKVRLAGLFDADPAKVGQELFGLRVQDLADLPAVVKKLKVRVGIVAVPAPRAQAVASLMARAGIRGLVNFAPAQLSLPPGVYVENIDLAVSLERAAFMARRGEQSTRSKPP